MKGSFEACSVGLKHMRPGCGSVLFTDVEAVCMLVFRVFELQHTLCVELQVFRSLHF